MAAELVTRVMSPLMEKLEKVKRQLIYLCCFNSNIESLREEAESLRNERDGLQRRVDTAKRNTDDNILPVVDIWLQRSDEIQVDTNGIEDEIMNVKSGCLAIKSRFLLSRKARKTADAINLLREKGKFEEISLPAPPPAMAPIPQGPSDEFDSRKQIENEIMKDLRGGKVHMIGICGMGGVGKTTVAKRIWTRVREEKLYEEVAMVVITQEVKKFEIQSEIAEKFGLLLLENSFSVRARKLHKRLSDATRKLLILDDIWEELNLESLGIPCKSDEREGCTIILTSQSREVLNLMNAKPFGVQILTPEEALLLFRGKIGTCMEPEEVLKQVVEECEGLPLALVTIGLALKDKGTEHWNDALRKLKSSNPTIPKVLKEVYEPIKVSYDFLGNPNARSLFLLCCLFPKDCDIDLEYLMMYGTGLCMFTDEITTLQEARDSVLLLVDMLKACSLLLDGSDKNHVKMHRFVRAVAIYIVSEEGLFVRNLSSTASGREESINCKWISVVGEEINKLPIGLSFPSLRLLRIDDYSADVEVNADPSFFRGMIELNVLFFYGISFRSLPETTRLLKNLRTLHLEECNSLETISIVGELLSLEILVCRSCFIIAELPVEIGRLKQLRMLEVNQCPELTRIAPGVISNLVQLEELIIVKSFNGWEMKANGEQRKNAALCEIEHLEKLTRLEIDIGDVSLTTPVICFPSRIGKFVIRFGREFPFYDVRNEITPLLKNLRTLYLEQCDSLEAISIIGELLSLEVLVCRSCDMIVELPVEIGRLEKLRILEVYKCRKLEKIARGVISNLVQLEELMIVKSFNEWETEAYGEQRGNAAICEIEHLEKLRRMEIEIKDSTLAAELDKGKVKYQLRSGGSRWESCEVHDTHSFARWIKDIVDGMVLLKYDSIITCYLWRHQNPPDHSFRRLEAIEIYDSRKQIENAIMKDLRGGKVHIIGICGIQGLGKTTMARSIINRVREENLFDEGMMVVISQEVRELEIQIKIAEMLGVSLEDESLSARANKLRVLLMGAKRILLILDNISDKLDLERLGIPCKSDLGEGCTILLTSRNREVLSDMNAKPFEVQILTEEEAMILFRGKIGTCADDKGLLPIPEVVKECKGLPLTLVTTGTALKDKSVEHWREALRNLRSSNLNIPEEVYEPIKERYDSLDKPVAKSLFLLCCLFPKDCDIDLEYLVMYGMGSRMFADEITTLEKARNSVRLLVDMLKTCSLLQDGSDENHVKMRDDVRSIAIFIASHEGRIVRNLSSSAYGRREPINCNWISVVGEETNNLPILSSFPSLRLLKIDDNYPTEVEISKDSSFFEGMIELNVLSFRSISFRSLPETMQLLKKLRTLYLDSCTSLETISIVGELLSLEILICRSCDMISELPVEIGRLKNLRMLEVYKCQLKTIAREVISNLVRLEELMIIKSFNEWETVTNGEQRGNAAISEIEHLEKLSRMEIQIKDSTLAAEMMFLDRGKVKYQVRFGGSRWESCELHDTHGFARWIKDIVEGTVLLKYDTSTCYLWRHPSPPDHFFRRLEAIEIYDYSAGRLFHSSTAVYLDGVKELRISKCKNMVKVIENDQEQFFRLKLHTLFPSLHNLYLEDLPKLESFSWSRALDFASLENVWIKCCHRLEFFSMQNVQLHCLKKVVISDCNNIERLFSTYMAANLGKLTTLSISRCKEMVQVIEKNEVEPRTLFPELKELEFHDLPKLQSFSNSEYDLELPSLENVDIYSCPLWKKFSMGPVTTSNLKRVVYNSKVTNTRTLEW